jgi:hypothetical protein
MGFLKSLFSGPEGEISSKRVFAIVCLIVAIIAHFTGTPWEGVALWLGTAATTLGIQAFTGK